MTSEQQPPPPRAFLRGASAATSEVILALFAFVSGLVLLLAVPGVRSAIFGVLDLTLGRPQLSPEKIRQAQSIVLTPLATLAAALLYGWLGRRVDRLAVPATRLLGPSLAPRPAAHLALDAAIARPTAAGRTLAEIAFHVLLALAGSYLIALLMHALGLPVAEQGLVLELTASGDLRRPELAILTLSALVLAPLGEELFFRRQLLRRSWRSGGPLAAYLASALLFAAFHGNLQGFIIYAWLGLVFAHAYARTGRIGAAIAVHFGNNAVTLAILLLAPPTP